MFLQATWMLSGHMQVSENLQHHEKHAKLQRWITCRQPRSYTKGARGFENKLEQRGRQWISSCLRWRRVSCEQQIYRYSRFHFSNSNVGGFVVAWHGFKKLCVSHGTTCLFGNETNLLLCIVGSQLCADQHSCSQQLLR